MLIDDVKIQIAGGDGGKGAVAWNKNMMSLGPAGGSGGNGGSIYFEGVSDLSALKKFRYKKEFFAENGQNGKPQFNDGHNGEDIILKVPVGTIIYNLDNKSEFEIVKVGERILAAKGGRGGKGNFHFRSSTNTSPTDFQEGKLGEKFALHLELKLIADVGFIGLPNVGKSSLLNELTKADVKVANYPFTTLEPNLGVYYELILADIPGLIEGASSGKGLGIKFLKHIERTKILFHFISCESEDVVKDYETVRDELDEFSEYGDGSHSELVEESHRKNENKQFLNEKLEYLFLTKTDLIKPEEVKKKMTALKSASRRINKNIIAISIYDWDSLEKVKEILNEIKKEKVVVGKK